MLITRLILGVIVLCFLVVAAKYDFHWSLVLVMGVVVSVIHAYISVYLKGGE